MLFRLTFVLVGGLFLAMYFAPDLPEESRAARAQAEAEAAAEEVRTPPAPQPDAPRATGPVAEEAPAPTGRQTATAPAPQDDAAGASSEAGDVSGDEEASDFATIDPEAAPTRAAPLIVDGLSGGDSAAALSLSERVRARAEAERAEIAENAPAAEAPTEPAAATPRLPGPGERRAQVVATSVNLRGGPSTANPVVGRVDFGDELVYLGEASPGWARIRHPETGADAFMASRFLQTLGN